MSALSANRDSKRSVGDIVSMAGASGQHIYAGALTQINTSGYLVEATGVTANRFAGVAWDEIDNSSTNKKLSSISNGGLYGRVYQKGVFTFAANGTPAQTDIGKMAYILDDQTVGVSVGCYVPAGRIVDFTSSTYRVAIDSAIGYPGCFFGSGASGSWIGA